MPARSRCLFVLSAFLAVRAFAADPPWYARKATWEKTLEASREAWEKARKEAPPSVPLPDFGKDDFTVMAWIRTRHDGTIVAKAPASGKWAPQGKTFFVRQGRLCMDIGWVGSVQSRRQVADGKWHHVAVAKQGSTLRFHTDGQPDGGGKLKFGADVGGHVVKIGFTCPDFPRTGSGFRGELDDVRIYRRALSADDIRAHAGKLQPAKAKGLVAYLPFEDGLADASGSHNDATASGKLATADGKFGKALKLAGKAHAVVGAGGAPRFDSLVWPLLERDFGIVRLFDGSSLDGWLRRNRPGHGWGSVWAATDGAIDGVQEWPEALGMLATRRAFADFELRLEVKTDWPIDTGILLRESGFGRGCQVVIHCRPDGDVGGIAVNEPAELRAPAKGWKGLWKKDDWNRLRIVIRGDPPEIRTWLNGKPTATWKHDGKGDRPAARGPIALKVRGDGDCFNNHACFRNILLLQLKR